MKEFMRRLALLLCLALCVTMLPQDLLSAAAYATEDVLAGADAPYEGAESAQEPEADLHIADAPSQENALSVDEGTAAPAAGEGTAENTQTEAPAPEAGETTPAAGEGSAENVQTEAPAPEAGETTPAAGEGTAENTQTEPSAPEAGETTPAAGEGTAENTQTEAPAPEAGETETQPSPEPVIITPSLSCTSATIGRGDDGLVLKVSYSDGKTVDDDGSPRNVSFKTSKKKVASVDSQGRVTGGSSRGSATITAITPYGNVECKVKVVYAPKKISVEIGKTELMLGKTTQLTASYPSGYGGTYEYRTTDETVAKVDSTGKVTAAGKGTAIVGVQSFNGKTAKKTVTVYAPASSIEIAESSLLMSEKMSAKLQVILPAYERAQLSYTSSNPEIASVDASGRVEAHAVGTTQITVTTDNGLSVTRELKVQPMPTSVAFTVDSLKIGVDEAIDLSPYISVSEGSAAEYTYKSSSGKYVSVNSEGKIVGERKGKATITVETHNGLTARITINVYKAPGKVKLSDESITLGVNQTGKLSASFSSGYYGGVSFSSSDESVAAVSADGTIRAVGAGRAKITCETYNGKKDTCDVTVLPAPESISAAEAEMTLGVGETTRKAKGVVPSGTLCSFSYASSNPDIVSIEPGSGKMNAKALGEATITITSNNGKTAEVKVQVLSAPTEMKLSAKTLKIAVGETNTSLKAIVDEGAASGLTLKSSSTKYVKIVDGALYGVKAGTATITATTYNGLSATCKVTVGKAPSRVSFEEDSYTLGAGMSLQLEVKYNSSSAYSLCSFESSDAGIVSVDPATGVITGVSEGTAKIRVTTLNGKKDTCDVTVLPAPESISAAEAEMTLGVGETTRKAKGVAPSGTLCSFSYASSNPDIVSIEPASGKMNAKALGEATITITSNNGKTAEVKVQVLSAPTEMKLSAKTLKIAVGETNSSLKAIVDEGAASGLTLKSSSTKYVKIVDGALYGVKAGTATITATTYNGLSATCKVTVAKAPSRVSFASEDYEIGVGMQAMLEVEYNSSSAYSLCSFESSDASIVSVDPATGEISALCEGTAKVRATTLNGKTATCTVRVYPAPSALEFVADPLKMPVGLTTEAETRILPEQVGELSYESSDPTIVSIGPDGDMTANAIGTAIITVTTYNGVSDSFTVEVVEEPVEISFAAPKVSIVKGDIVEMPELTALTADGTETICRYTFTSSNKKVAQVNSEGLVKGVKNGTVTITATAYNGLTATFKLYVMGSIEGVSLSTNAATLTTDGAAYHETLQLTAMVEGVSAGSISYSSSNKSVATVSEDGLVTAVAPGTATISATSFNGVRARCKITVQALSSTISLGDAKEAVIGAGESMQLTPVFEANTSAKVVYTSSDESIATVNTNGYVLGRAAGSVTLTATMQNGVSASIALQVLAAPTGISFARSGMILSIGGQEKLAYTLEASEETYRDTVTFASSRPDVAAVAADGTVTALKTGSAVITATTCNGLTARCDVLVQAEGEQIEAAFGRSVYHLEAGDSTRLSILLSADAAAMGYTIASSNPEIASVTGNEIQALGVGSTTLTLTVNQPAQPEPPAAPEAPSEGEAVPAPVNVEPIIVTCVVNVCDAAQISMPASISMYTNTSMALEVALNPADLAGGFDVEVDNDLISYDPATGMITASDKAGTAVITVSTRNAVKTCTVDVHGPIYRSLVIAEFNESGYSNDLQFAGNNVDGIAAALGNSSVNGAEYAIKKVANNPSKSEIRRLLTTTFADATEHDVSVIYIVAHGHQNVGDTDGYGFSLPGYKKTKPSSYVTAEELYSWIEDIEGHVVLTLCTCRSGGFIDQMEEQLEKKGNISVVCSSHYSTVSSYYSSDVPRENVDFFTQALLEAIGYDEVNREFFKKLYADSDGDGNVTLSEAFSYTAKRMREIVYEKCGLGEFAGNVSQAVQYFLNGLEKNLILSSWNK